MRTLMLSAAALVAALVVTATPAPAEAQGVVNRLSDLSAELRQLNWRRPHDEFQAAIAHQLDMIEGRFQQVYSRRLGVPQALSLVDESLYDIQQYNNNGRDRAPWLARRIDMIVAEMRGIIANRQGAWNSPPPPVPSSDYVPPPRPVHRGPWAPPPVYVPSPAPVQPYRGY